MTPSASRLSWCGIQRHRGHPVERDCTVPFCTYARSLVWRANEVAALHKRAKNKPGKHFTDGVTAVRQAVAILQRILPADD